MAKWIVAAVVCLLLSALHADAGNVTETDCSTNANACDGIAHSECDTGRCKCSANYGLANEDTACKLQEGQTCTDNNECISNVCDPPTGARKCSGAPAAVTASIVLMTSAFLTSRFF